MSVVLVGCPPRRISGSDKENGRTPPSADFQLSGSALRQTCRNTQNIDDQQPTKRSKPVSEINSVNLAERLASFDDCWVPKIVGELNGQYVKVVKFVGEYVWHQHDDQDELFLVLDGQMKLELEDKVIDLKVGEFVIVPRKMQHRPVADSLCEVLLFEPVDTVNTGGVDHRYTIKPDDLETI